MLAQIGSQKHSRSICNAARMKKHVAVQRRRGTPHGNNGKTPHLDKRRLQSTCREMMTPGRHRHDECGGPRGNRVGMMHSAVAPLLLLLYLSTTDYHAASSPHFPPHDCSAARSWIVWDGPQLGSIWEASEQYAFGVDTPVWCGGSYGAVASGQGVEQEGRIDGSLLILSLRIQDRDERQLSNTWKNQLHTTFRHRFNGTALTAK